MENYNHSGQTRPTGNCKNLSAQKGLSPKVVLERPFDVIKPRTAKSVYETIHDQPNVMSKSIHHTQKAQPSTCLTTSAAALILARLH